MRLHRGQPVLTAGEDLGAARAAVVMVHGRGATARSILTLAPRLDIPGVAFLGCADPDRHIRAQRVRAAADELRRLGGEVTVRLYPGGEHAVSSDELETVAGMLGNLVPAL